MLKSFFLHTEPPFKDIAQVTYIVLNQVFRIHDTLLVDSCNDCATCCVLSTTLFQQETYQNKEARCSQDADDYFVICLIRLRSII